MPGAPWGRAGVPEPREGKLCRAAWGEEAVGVPVGQDEEWGWGCPVSRALLGTPSPAETARPSRPPRSRRLAGACAAAGRRECLTRSFPRPSRAGNGLVSSYTPYIARTGPGRAGARWPPALQPLPRRDWEPAVLSGGCRGHWAPETDPVPCLAAAGGRSWGGFRGTRELLPGEGWPICPEPWPTDSCQQPWRAPEHRDSLPAEALLCVRRWARSQLASARPAAGVPAWLLCQVPQVASCSSCMVAANSPGKNASGSHPEPAPAFLWSEMVSAFNSMIFWAPARERTSWFWERESRAHKLWVAVGLCLAPWCQAVLAWAPLL